MARADIRAFIRQWHEAMTTLAPPDLETELPACQAELLRKLDTQHLPRPAGHQPAAVRHAVVAWREVVLMTTGQANLAQRTELIRGLLSRAERSPELLERVRLATEKLLPPKDTKAATELTVVGEAVLDHLPPSIAIHPEETAVACALCVHGDLPNLAQLTARAPA